MSVYQIKCGMSGAEEEEQGSEEDEEETARLLLFNSLINLDIGLKQTPKIQKCLLI